VKEEYVHAGKARVNRKRERGKKGECERERNGGG